MNDMSLATEQGTAPSETAAEVPSERGGDGREAAGAISRPRTTGTPSAPSRSSWWFLSPTATNFWLDVILAVLFVTQFWLAMVLRFVFPPGPAADGWKLWSASYEAWSRAQFVVTCLLACAVVLHLMLHWNWVCAVVIKWARQGKPKRPMVKDDPMRTIWGVILLIVLLGAIGVSLGIAKMTIISPY